MPPITTSAVPKTVETPSGRWRGNVTRSSRNSRPNRATTNPSAITAMPVRAQASIVRLLARWSRTRSLGGRSVAVGSSVPFSPAIWLPHHFMSSGSRLRAPSLQIAPEIAKIDIARGEAVDRETNQPADEAEDTREHHGAKSQPRPDDSERQTDHETACLS